MPVLSLDAEQLGTRGHELSEEYAQTSDIDKLNAALVCFERAVRRTCDDGLSRGSRLHNLERCHHQLYTVTRDVSHLDAAILVGRQSLDAVPANADIRVLYASLLSDNLAARYFARTDGDRTDFLASTETVRDALSLSSQASRYYSVGLSTLAARLGQYNEDIESNDAYLDESIAIGEQLVDYGSGPIRVFTLNLAVDLMARFHRQGHTIDLYRARDLFLSAIEAFPVGSDNHYSAVRQLSDCVVMVAERDKESATIEDALVRMASLDLDGRGNVELAKHYHSQSRLYNARYVARTNPDDLVLAVKASKRALDLSPASGVVRGAILQHLSRTLAVLGEARMDVTLMDAAIVHARSAVEISKIAPAQQSNAYTALGMRLSSRYSLFGGLVHLRDALHARERALELLPKDHYEYPTRMHNVACSCRDYFEAFGTLESLDRSISLERAAFDILHASNDPDQAMVMQGLSLSLSSRSQRTGSDQDLTEPIKASETAVATSQPGSLLKYAYMNTLANKLVARGGRHNDLTDLDRAVKTIGDTIAAHTGDASDELLYLVTQSNCLAARYDLTGSPDDLEGSLVAIEKAVEITPNDHPSPLGFQHNFGMRLEKKHHITPDREQKRAYLQRSYDIELQVTKELPEDHPDMPIYLPLLASRQLSLATFMDQSDEAALLEQLRQAAVTFTRAFNKVYAASVNRITSGNMAGYCWMSLKKWDRASEILSETVHMFRLASPVALDEQDRQRQLRGLSGISSLACTSYIALDKPQAALEILEAGRGIMANIAMGYHADLTPILQADAALHDRYVTLRDSISQAMPVANTHATDFVKTRFEELAEMEATEQRIRALPGFEKFQRGLSAQQMIDLASRGPIVTICTTDQRCDAIIATNSDIEILPLTDFKHADVKKRVPLVVGSSRLSSLGPLQMPMANKRMRALLAWLWEKVVRPVFVHLGLLGEGATAVPGTRLWWVTSGQLGLLPLHAAGKGHKHPAENANAHVITSYTPSFASLAFARQCEARVDPASSKAALVTMPQTPGGLGPLATKAEAFAVREAFSSNPDNVLIVLLQPSAANVFHEVRNGTANILHLACHADPSLSDPSNTALLFGSDPTASAPDALPVKELRRYQSPAAAPTHRALRLAYLSACCTAQQYDLRLMDENIHLAATFQTLGFPDVVGTLWEADDAAAVVVAGAFYRELFKLDKLGGRCEGNIARALHVAVSECRTRKLERGDAAEDVLAWASFVHIGA